MVCGMSFLNFNFGFGCPLVVQMDFPFVQRAWGCGSQGVFRLGMFLSIFLKVSRRFVVAVSIHGVWFFFLGLGLVQVDFPLMQGA